MKFLSLYSASALILATCILFAVPQHASAAQILGGPEPSHSKATIGPDASKAGEARLRRGIVQMELQPVTVMTLTAPFTGTLLGISVRDGESVREGQALASFDPTLVESLDADKNENLQSEREARKTLVAPFDARITEVRAKAGQRVAQGDAILEIVKNDELEVVCTVPATWLQVVNVGHRFQIHVDETAEQHDAQITRIGGKVDPTTRSIYVYAKLVKKSPTLLPGMSGSATLIQPQK